VWLNNDKTSLKEEKEAGKDKNHRLRMNLVKKYRQH
jgi:hypothetical protein